MSNIHGVFHSKAEKKSSDEELTQMGSSNSATATWRPTGAHNNQSQSTADIIAHAKGQQSSSNPSSANDRNIGIITLYGNGFVIGNGEFRSKEDPRNARFLAALKAGEVPDELELMCRNEWKGQTEFGIQLVDKTNVNFEVPKPKFDFAASQGHSLSSSSTGSGTSAFATATPQQITHDAAQPSTTIQIVLADKRKIKQSVNHSSTVLQLYQHIMHLSGQSGFELIAGFPPRPLQQPDATIKEAGLIGASVQQR